MRISKVLSTIALLLLYAPAARAGQVTHAGVKPSTWVEYPIYYASGYGFNDKKFFGHAHQIFSQEYKYCRPSKKPFKKNKDSNVHPYFPVLQPEPIAGDHLGAFFFKDLKEQRFIVWHWAWETLPIITFHLTPAAEKYRPWIREAMDYLNANIQRVTNLKTPVVALSSEIKSLDKESCGAHLIHLTEEDLDFHMMTYLNTVNDVENRLGEIVDADTIIVDKYYIDLADKADASYVKKHFQLAIVHEVLHALGFDHNYYLGSIMGHFDPDKIELQNVLSDYEINTLNYLLFNDGNLQKKWALTRTYHTPSIHPQKYLSQGVYSARVVARALNCGHADLEKSLQGLMAGVDDLISLKVDSVEDSDCKVSIDISGLSRHESVPGKVMSCIRNASSIATGRVSGNVDIASRYPLCESIQDYELYAKLPTLLEDLGKRESKVRFCWKMNNETNPVECTMSVNFVLENLK